MKREDGFTLVEMIISIAILSIVILAMLRLFGTSAKISAKTYEEDKLANISINTQEIFKSIPNDLTSKEGIFSNSQYTFVQEVDNRTEYIKYYDRSFQELQAASATAPEETKYILTAKVEKTSGEILSEDIVIGTNIQEYILPDTPVKVFVIKKNQADATITVEEQGKDRYKIKVTNDGADQIYRSEITDNILRIIIDIEDIYNREDNSISIDVIKEDLSEDLSVKIWLSFGENTNTNSFFSVIKKDESYDEIQFPESETSNISKYSVYDLDLEIKENNTDEIIYEISSRKYFYGQE